MTRNKTIVVDLESAPVFELHDYQKQMLSRITDGFKPGEMVLFSGRQTGKSHFYQQQLQRWMQEHMPNRPPYEVTSTSTVDGDPWYEVKCNSDASAWIRAQNKKSWYEHNHSYKWGGMYSSFDINEKLFIMLKVGFSV